MSLGGNADAAAALVRITACFMRKTRQMHLPCGGTALLSFTVIAMQCSASMPTCTQ